MTTSKKYKTQSTSVGVRELRQSASQILDQVKDGVTIETLRHDPDLIAVIQTAVDEANKAVSKAESIRKFTILGEDFTIAGGHLTAKLSVKRHVVAAQYAKEIDDLYAKE